MAEQVSDLLDDETIVFDDDGDDEDSGGTPVWDEHNNVLRVMKAKCSTCIYGPNSLVRGSTTRAVEADAADDEYGFIQCHHTLPSISGRDDIGAICRGWWDRFSGKRWIFRLAKRDNVVSYVEEPPMRDGINVKGVRG